MNSDLYSFIAAVARQAGSELTRRRGAGLGISVKADRSLVTDADLASERVILERIGAAFPSDTVYSEESGWSTETRRVGTHVWIVDPLDGTTNFANGYPFYCVSIGRGRFLSDGSIEMLAGAVFDVPRGRLYYAERGKGAHVDGVPLRVAPTRPIAQGFLITGFYYLHGSDLQVEIERFARIADRCQTVRRDGAAALDLAFVSEGVADAFWEIGLKAWDVAAGSLLVTEAGGHVRNYPPAPASVYNVEVPGIIAGSPAAVEAIAALL